MISFVGSVNMDMVIRVQSIARVGETVEGGEFITAPGGKGANQAVAAAKAGGVAYFIAKVGQDNFGENLVSSLNNAGVKTNYLTKETGSQSGIALIMVDAKGQNIIAVSAGANMKLSRKDIDFASPVIKQSKALVLELAIPLDTIEHALMLAKEYNIKTIVNATPVSKFDAKFISKIDVIIINEIEASILANRSVSNIISGEEAIRCLKKKGIPSVVITLGEKGLLIAEKNNILFVRGHSVQLVDTIAAGDAFVGGFACAIDEGMTLFKAAEFGNYVAALSVTKAGAQPSMPTRQEIENLMEQNKTPQNSKI